MAGLNERWQPAALEQRRQRAVLRGGGNADSRRGWDYSQLFARLGDPLFEDPGLGTTNANQLWYDVSADGQRFVMVGTVETEVDKAPSIHVVENWFAEFRDRQGGAQ